MRKATFFLPFFVSFSINYISMLDSFNREINYLRISVTDLCNLRCSYCMPDSGVSKLSHEEIISPERIKEIVEHAANLGITKVRITGGEPLVRKGIIDIVKNINEIKGIKEICLTTNGVLLPLYAKQLKDNGVTRLNISLDTLKEDKYLKITRLGHLEDVLKGIKSAKELGFQIKVNTVLIGGFNDDELIDFKDFAKNNDLTLRFIELMPIGESKSFKDESYLSNDKAYAILKDYLEYDHNDGVSKVYKVKESNAYIGFISPLSHSFCKNCSRLRLTSEGKLRPCLHSSLEIATKGLSGEELKEAIRKAIMLKPKEHHLSSGSENPLNMNEIGG